MENYIITKEQILETIRTGTDVTERYFKEIIPDAFKKELEIGKWYKTKKEGFEKCLFNFLGEKDECIIAYGFNAQGAWSSKAYWFLYYKTMEFLEATPEEVSTALINEAKKRGYKKGVTIQWKSRPKLIYKLGDDEFDYLESRNVLVFGDYGIFERGEWAEILSQEKTVITMEKALKIIAKKMKVSPENIEIQY